MSGFNTRLLNKSMSELDSQNYDSADEYFVECRFFFQSFSSVFFFKKIF